MPATGRFRLIVAAIAVAVSAAGALVWSRSVGGEPSAADEVRLDIPGEYVEPGAPTNPPLATDQLPAVTLERAAGGPADLRTDGRPMVINLWYSTCAPCASCELADFADVDAELGGEVRFVGVNPYDTAATMTTFAADRGVDYELLRDPGFEFVDALGIVAFPVTLFVAADGRILERTGPIDDAELRRRVAEHWSSTGREPDVNVGLSFLRGMIAAVNPCGFVLLPTYLVYFLGLEAARADTQRASVRRALLVSAAVTAGFMAVFVVVGAISTGFTSWLVEQAKYVTGLVGVALVVVGVAMLFGYRLRVAMPALGLSRRDLTVRSMFVYGIAYAVVSLSCTLVLFIPTMFAAGERDGIVAGVVNGGAFALGMGLLVTALTVTLAVANHAVLRVLRSSMRHVSTLAAAFVLLSGLYLLYYFWVVDVREDSGAVTNAVERFQNWVSVSLNDNWRTAAVVLGGIVLAAVAYVVRRRSDGEPPVGSPERERTTTH